MSFLKDQAGLFDGHRLLIFLREHGDPLPPRAALTETLKITLRNWRRERFAPIPVEYWYGKAALARWAADLGEVEGLAEEQQQQLRNVGSWNFAAMHDARRAAVSFLKDQAGLFEDRAAEALARAGAAYQQETELLAPALADDQLFSRSLSGWTPDVREREREILRRAAELEELAVAALDEALELAA